MPPLSLTDVELCQAKKDKERRRSRPDYIFKKEHGEQSGEGSLASQSIKGKGALWCTGGGNRTRKPRGTVGSNTHCSENKRIMGDCLSNFHAEVK